MTLQRVGYESAQYITQYSLGTLRNVLIGSGVAYAIEREEYHHIPLIFIVPSIYSGYHLFTKREAVKVWLKDICPKPRQKGFW